MKNIEKKILDFVQDNPNTSSISIHEGTGGEVSLATIKRALSALVSDKTLDVVGKGRATRYRVSSFYRLFQEIDMEVYYRDEIDEREIIKEFDFSLLDDLLPEVELFNHEESAYLEKLQSRFATRLSSLNLSEIEKEFERLAIDLSWKSSQIEGNTYSLLETERLLKERQTASGKTQRETIMLLNHKEAIDFIIQNPNYLTPISVSKIEDIHTILTQELQVERSIRKRRVGISGTNYRPLDNAFQITDALTKSCQIINSKTNVFEQALLSLLLISYIQPFVDGNKRTARIVSNAILLGHRHCPISFRTVDSIDYKKAMLLFYEQNNIIPMKNIFMEQYAFATETYF